MDSKVKRTGRNNLLYWKSRFKTRNLLQSKGKDMHDLRCWEYRETDRMYVFLYNMRPTILYCRKTNSTGELRSSIYEMNKETGLTAKIRLFSERKELLDDDKMHYRYKQISVVYGDEIAVHVKDVKGRYIAFGIHGLDKVQTLKDKLPGVFYQTDSLLRNGKELESNCYISSYNMRNGTVLESGYEHSRFKIRKISYSEHREESPYFTTLSRETTQDDSSVVMDEDDLMETVGRFEDICGSLQSETDVQFTSADRNKQKTFAEAISAFGNKLKSLIVSMPKEALNQLAHNIGLRSLANIASAVDTLIREGNFGIPGFLEMARGKVLTDNVLTKLSSTIGRNWEFLAKVLGVHSVAVDHITADFGTTQMRIFRMFKKWIEIYQDDATADNLLRAIWNSRELGVNVDEFKLKKIFV